VTSRPDPSRERATISTRPSCIWYGRVLLGVLSTLWVGLSLLLIIPAGDAESFLRSNIVPRHPDAFRGLNVVLVEFWVTQTCLFGIAVAAVHWRRFDVLTVLVIGPVVGATIGVLAQGDLSDPDWCVMAGVCTIGWLVGVIVGAGFWLCRMVGPRSDGSPL
jgi:hypothetical protein